MTTPASGALRERVLRILDDSRTVSLACAVTLGLGLFFLFIWSPLPWGWLGIDHYDDRARRLAAGAPFDTTDVPWGYAYYLAFFYALFGPHPWIPLVFQVLLNALVPFLLWRLVRPLAGQRAAVLAAVLAGVFSFNTVYTSTQSSDAVCTVLLLASLLLFERGRRTRRLVDFAVSGLVVGIAAQFRPNLILFGPFIAAIYVVTRPRDRRKPIEIAAYLALVIVALTPWVVRNYRLTHSFLPTSTHGGVQLWYGTLQMGPYLESRVDNPRSYFEVPPFDYTSLDAAPVEVSAVREGCAGPVELVYWTGRNSTPVRLTARNTDGDRLQFELPSQPDPTTIYYYFEARGRAADEQPRWTPPGGPAEPFLYFVSSDHLGDLDRQHDLLDVFDLVRLVRFVEWHEAVELPEWLDLDDNGSIEQADLRRAAQLLAENVAVLDGEQAVQRIDTTEDSATLRFSDGSTLTIPRAFAGRVTDLEASGGIAGQLLHARRSPREIRTIGPDPRRSGWCGAVTMASVNDAFYLTEPQQMRRYMALALDNIGRDPAAFATASLYRMVRLFVIRGSDDQRTTQQFAASGWIYAFGLLLSLSYLMLFAAGVWIAWRRRSPLLALLAPIVYVPLTIAFVLTNMRYTVTVQPYIFAFVAVALLRVLEKRPAER